jgi:hypothetical protein
VKAPSRLSVDLWWVDIPGQQRAFFTSAKDAWHHAGEGAYARLAAAQAWIAAPPPGARTPRPARPERLPLQPWGDRQTAGITDTSPRRRDALDRGNYLVR